MNTLAGPRSISLAIRDVKDGLLNVPVWSMLAWQEVRQRYRRSMLGPFWLTISMGALVAGMGPLYGRLFGQDLGEYFPYLAIGIVVWQLMASLINDSTQVFIGAEQYIKQIRLPFTIHVMRMVWRNAIIFGHNLVIVLLVLIFFLPTWAWWAPLSILGMAAILINGVWIGLLFGLVCARFRDIAQIISSVVQIAFFFTPVMWKPEMLGRHQWAAQVNPLHHLLEVVRGPLLGARPSVTSWAVVVLITAAGFAFTTLLFSRYRARIAYWV